MTTYEVYVSDPSTEQIAEMHLWLEKNQIEPMDVESIDVADVSLVFDVVMRFTFDHEEDALLFKMRWSWTNTH